MEHILLPFITVQAAKKVRIIADYGDAKATLSSRFTPFKAT